MPAVIFLLEAFAVERVYEIWLTLCYAGNVRVKVEQADES